MRISNVQGRLVLAVTDTEGIDVERASGGTFSADPALIFQRWPEFVSWAATVDQAPDTAIESNQLEAPSPAPSQVFAIGLNYRAHAEESGFKAPTSPVVFTKFQSSITGPNTTVKLPAQGQTDWETELVVVIGKSAFQVPEEDAWSYVAGMTLGQDLSERITQQQGPAPQFSLGKSYPGFAPTGPWLVTLDEFENPEDLALGCSINGVEMQNGRTRDFIFTIPSLIAHLSSIVTLQPGDLIFTGTPAGVGLGRTPQVWLQPGDELVTWAEGIGELRQTFVA